MSQDKRRWQLAFKKGPLTAAERQELAEINKDYGDPVGPFKWYREGMTAEEIKAALDQIREE